MNVVVLPALLPLLALRRPWIPRLFQVICFLAGVEWIRTLVVVAQARQAVGEDWLRFAMILGGVALLAFLAPLVFERAGLRSRYRRS